MILLRKVRDKDKQNLILSMNLKNLKHFYVFFERADEKYPISCL